MDNISWQEAKSFEILAKEARKQGDYEKASKLNLKAADIYKNLGNVRKYKINLANYYENKGKLFTSFGQFEKAREYFGKAEAIFLELNMKKAAFL